ncbi:hypothetical protein D6C77_07970 [Aureobasidium pullulans]|uniref:GRF-type domain-containing protein n=1 Tax=Aureobasidium pullulans TaxID=5580 RepID=A0AB74JM22_AURPU|nr:hypothetical protein D6D12_07606 [Aureobasidium pullulans]THX65171.1 hypothetical protein D6D11_00658 [Aureobasidium pullulans]TIA53870.1 hypothetical protein D6C77_07970 [Aureobasidium pullulans]
MTTMFKRVPKVDTATTLPATNNGSSNSGGVRGRGSTFTRRPGRQKLTGLFAHGIWHCDCDCEPRLPAEHFQVKKESANKGRWFYTCQNGEGRRCGFFLWDDDAKPREAAAVLSNSRTEPRTTPNKPLSPVHQSPQTTQSSTSTLSHPSSALKRPLSDTGFDDADDHDSFPWSLSGQEKAEILNVPETPRKAVKFDALATPATSVHRKLPWLDNSANLPSAISARRTPSKDTALPGLTTPSHSRLAAVQQGALTPQVTPSPLRFRDSSADASSPRSTLTADVLAAFDTAEVTLPGELSSKLRDVLTRHELRTQGVIKGREITRLALKARDAKIVELQATIASLEAEREVDQARVRSLEWEKEFLAKGQEFDTEL